MPTVRFALLAAVLAWGLSFNPPSSLAAGTGAAQASAPSGLEQWRGWIEQSRPERDCPGRDAEACVWLGPLDLVESGRGWRGSFAASNLMAKDVKLRLPGADGSWPSLVKVDGAAALVGRDAQGPYVMLGAKKRADVVFEFSLERSASSTLPLPPGFPMASIDFAGGDRRHVDASQPADLSPAKDASAAPVQAGGASPAARDKPTVRVSRLLQDSQVPTMFTRVKIENGPQRRVVTIEGIVPDGASVFEMRAPGGSLTGRSLSIEAPPGVSVVLLSSAMDPNLAIKWGEMSSPDSQLADRQYVFVQSDERFRKVSAQGDPIDPKSIDPALSFGPLPAYALGIDGKGLAFEPKPIEKQGDDSAASVRSEAWLSFDGAEVFLLEKMSFSRSVQGWFEPMGGWSATQAISGDGPVVVAKSDKGQAGRVATSTGMGSLEVGMSAPASLWLGVPAIASEGIVAKTSQALLHLPLGWRVLGVFGAGHSDSGWLASLSLWDWFLLIVAVWVAKSLLGWRAGATLLAAMALGRLFLGAPFAIYLPLLAALALARHLPQGGFKNASLAMVALFMAMLLAQAAPYTMSRIQKTMHASLEDGAQPGGDQSATKSALAMWRNGSGSDGPSDGVQSALIGAAIQANSMPGAAAPAESDAGPFQSDQAGGRAMLKSDLSSLASAPMAPLGAAPRPAASAAGAQAGQGLPAWRSGLGIPIAFPAPASAGAVARVLLMPAWLAKICGLLSIAAMWAALGSMLRVGWRLAGEARREAFASRSLRAGEEREAEAGARQRQPQDASQTPQDASQTPQDNQGASS